MSIHGTAVPRLTDDAARADINEANISPWRQWRRQAFAHGTEIFFTHRDPAIAPAAQACSICLFRASMAAVLKIPAAVFPEHCFTVCGERGPMIHPVMAVAVDTVGCGQPAASRATYGPQCTYGLM